MEKVIILSGEEAVRRYFDVMDRSRETVGMLLEHIDVYEFDTVAEAEAFREGLCAAHTPNAKEVCELTLLGHKSLLQIQTSKEFTQGSRTVLPMAAKTLEAASL